MNGTNQSPGRSSSCYFQSYSWWTMVLSSTFLQSMEKRENKLSDEDLKNQNPIKLFGLTLFVSFIMSYNMAFFLANGDTDWSWGLTAGFLTGFGWAAAIFIIIGLYEMRSWKYIFINSGFIILYFSLIGFILGIWK